DYFPSKRASSLFGTKHQIGDDWTGIVAAGKSFVLGFHAPKTNVKKPASYPATRRSAARRRGQSKDDLKAGLCPIVGVGVARSTGGFEAGIDLLRHLPPKSGMAFVIVQQFDPHHPA